MTRVVIDANVYISALVFGGVPQRAIQRAQGESFRICVSEPIMDEVAGTLRRKFGWSRAELDFALPPLWRRVKVVQPVAPVDLCVDPDDNRVLECVRAAGARFLVTGDDHLLRLKQFEGAVILTPRQFLETPSA
jgi:putative PIN family toxin of toxin-antitoxin system